MIIIAEIKKLWSNVSFLIYLAILLIINVFLLWFLAQPSAQNIPSSAYKKIAEEMTSMSMEQKDEFLQQKYENANAMMILEELQNIAKDYGVDSDYYIETAKTNAQIIDEYSLTYSNGVSLEYTQSLSAEYNFLNIIKDEFDEVYAYDDFLQEINDNASTLSQISIFNTQNGFVQKNIATTVKAYENLSDVKIDYLPQKGIVTALNFAPTDIILVFIMILISIILIQREKETGVINLIKSTAGGHGKTALAKIIAICTSLFVVVLLIYGCNLIYCHFAFGINNLGASVQSVTQFMRCVLNINVLQYIFLFLVVKYFSIIIFGIWIMTAMLFAKKLLSGIVASLLMPVFFYVITLQISPASSLNVLHYANPISYLQTNNILANYQNLFWFNSPVNLVTVICISALFFTMLFLAFYFVGFKLGRFTQTASSFNYLPKFKKYKGTTVFKTECRKLLLINAGILLIVFALSYQGFRVVNTNIYLPFEETIYKEYVQRLGGAYTQEKQDFINEEYERFEQFIKADSDLQKGYITHEQHYAILSQDYNKQIEYTAFKKVIDNLKSIDTSSGAQLVYETGYLYLFGLEEYYDANSFEHSIRPKYNEENLHSAVLSTVLIVIALAGLFSMERHSGMRRILYSTPLGREATVKTKLIISAAYCFFVAAITSAPILINTYRVFGLSSLFAPAKSLVPYSNLPFYILIILLILLCFILRLLACAFIGAVTLFVSQKYSSKIVVIVICLSLFLLPLILIFMGFDIFSFLSIYQFFAFSAILAEGNVVLITIVIALALTYATYLLCCHIINKYCWYFTDL